MLRLLKPSSPRHWQLARALIEEYATSLNVDLSFQNIAHELDHLASEYGPPEGAFLLAELNGSVVGCVGVRRFAEDVGEIKRLYVQPAARGHKIARTLAQEIIAAAKALGYRRALLDTLPSMSAARALYVSLGFTPTAPYRYNPVAGTAFLALELS